jgi:hypothetical protein
MKNIKQTLALTLAAGLLASLGCRQDAESPTAPEPAPVLATATAALAFDQVSASLDHTCGVTTDHRAFCWGLNSESGGTSVTAPSATACARPWSGEGTASAKLAPAGAIPAA